MKPIYPDEKYHKLPSMTVGELMEKLGSYPPETVVIAEWEGTWNAFDGSNFVFDEREGRLCIDVENH